MPGSLSMTPVLLEGRKEYFGLEILKDARQRVRAEASSSKISNSSLWCLRVFLPPECCFLPSPVSYRCKPCNPACQLSLFCQGRSIWQVGEGPEVLWPQVPSVSPTHVTKGNHPDVVQGNLRHLLTGLLISAGRCHQQSRHADDAGSVGSATDIP